MADAALKDELAKILSQRAFQPRSDPESAAEQVAEYVRAVIVRWWRELKETLLPLLGISDKSLEPPEWLLGIFQAIADWSFILLVVSAVCALAYLLYRLYLMSVPVRMRTDSSLPLAPREVEREITRAELDELLREGRFIDCLIAFRRMVRRRIMRLHPLSPSTPDKKLLETVDDSMRAILEPTAVCYERCVLAGKSLSPDELRQLLLNVPAT